MFPLVHTLLFRWRNSPALRSLAWLASEKALRLVFGQAVVVVLLARYLGPQDFGLLSAAVALVSICGAAAGLGLDEIAVRELVLQPAARREQLLGNILWLKVLGALGGVAAALLAPGVFQLDQSWRLVALVAAGLLFSPWDVLDWWFQAQSRFRPPVQARLGAFLLSAGAKVALIALHAPLWTFAAATATEPLLVAFGLMVAARRAGWRRPRSPVDWQAARHLASEGFPLLLSGLFVLLSMHSDKVLVLRLAGSAAAGVYSAAARLTETLYGLPVALGLVLMPILAQYRQRDQARYTRLVRRTFLGLTAVGVVAAAGLSLAAGGIVGTVFGGRFAGSGPVLAVHAWVAVFIFQVSLRSRVLVLERKTRWVAGFAALTAAVSITANVLLIPRYGARGAAWSAVIAWGFSALLAPWLFPEMRAMHRKFLGRVGAP